MNIKNKTIIVTGGGNGMGQEMTLFFSKREMIIVININDKLLKKNLAIN